MSTSIRAIGAVIAVLSVTACATSAGSAKPNAGSAAVAQSSPCVAPPGSRLNTSDWNCSAASRTYTGADLNKTGLTPSQNGLQMLNPALTVHH
jgi:hypothetical protein